MHTGQNSLVRRISNHRFRTVGAKIQGKRANRRQRAGSVFSIGTGCAHSHNTYPGRIAAVQQNLQRITVIAFLRIRAAVQIDTIRIVHHIMRPGDSVCGTVCFGCNLNRNI